MPNLAEGEEILSRVVSNLIDLDNGSFERLLMALKEFSTLRFDYLTDEAVSLYLEIDGMFEKSNTHDTEGFLWKNLSEMSEDKKQEIANKLFLLFKIICRSAASYKS